MTTAIVVRSGVASALAPTDPLLALAIAPGDARVAAAAARVRLQAKNGASSPQVAALVSAALNRDVTITSAIELRALEFEQQGRDGEAALLFALSHRISRRSLGTHLWLIQRAVDGGDVNGALSEFDAALRTSSAAPNLLFPVLSRAMKDRRLQAPIARLLDRPSEWREMFLDYAVRDPVALAPVVLRMGDRGFVKSIAIDQSLIDALVDRNEFDAAFAVDRKFGSRAAPQLVRDGDFSRPDHHFPFGWGLNQAADVWAVRDDVRGAPTAVYRGLPGGSGQAASQLLHLQAGAYRLTVLSRALPTDPDALPFWSITCGGIRPVQIAQVDQPAKSPAASVDFMVPPDCAGQWLALNLRASDRATGQSGAIRSVTIARRVATARPA